MQIKDSPAVRKIIKIALEEDIGKGDITTSLLIPKNLNIEAVILAKEAGILAGIEVARLVFQCVDRRIIFRPKLFDGMQIKPSMIIAQIYGPARGILIAERTALNFLSRLCGIATLTHKFVQRARPYKTKIMDTRKTTPGLRLLEKYAVKAGGGFNHRFGLFDQVLVKDNHLKVTGGYGRLYEAAEGFKKNIPKGLKIEIEVKSLNEFKEALKVNPDIIMLDNMKITGIKRALAIRRKAQHTGRKAQLEVSGGVTLKNIAQIAKTGTDMVSIGALTHSVKSLDMSLEIIG